MLTVFDDSTYSVTMFVPVDGIPYYQSAPVRASVAEPEGQNEEAILVCVELLGPSFAVSSPRDDVCFRQISDRQDGEDWRWSLFPDGQAIGKQELIVVASFDRNGKLDSASFTTQLEVHKSPFDRTPALASAALLVVLGGLLTFLTRKRP